MSTPMAESPIEPATEIQPPKESAGKAFAKDLLAGVVGGWFQVVSGHPFDTIKVKLQTDTTLKSPLDAVQKTYRAGGPLGFYAGMGSPMIGIGACVAAQFVSFNQALMFLTPGSTNPRADASLRDIILAGGFSGFASSFVTSPVEHVKCKMQAQVIVEGQAPKYTGPVQATRLIFQEAGWRGVYHGLNSTILREVPSFMIYFGGYESIRRALIPEGGTLDDVTLPQCMFAGALSGVFLWMGVYPLDVIKSTIQNSPVVRPGQKPTYTGILHCAQSIYAKQGVRGFFKGFLPCVLRAPIANGFTFLGYELARGMLKPL